MSGATMFAHHEYDKETRRIEIATSKNKHLLRAATHLAAETNDKKISLYRIVYSATVAESVRSVKEYSAVYPGYCSRHNKI